MLPKQKVGCCQAGLQTCVSNGYTRIISPISTQMYTGNTVKLWPFLAISIQSVVEACFNTKVKVYSHAMKTNKALVDPACRKMVRQY